MWDFGFPRLLVWELTLRLSPEGIRMDDSSIFILGVFVTILFAIGVFHTIKEFRQMYSGKEQGVRRKKKMEINDKNS